MMDTLSNPASRLKFPTFGAKRVRSVFQSEIAECGLACMAMVLDANGFRIALRSLRQKFSFALAGCSMSDLLQISEGYSMQSRVVAVKTEHLGQLQLPAILHWQKKHFVVLERLHRGKAVIHDPARGRLTLPIAEFDAAYSGVALESIPSQGFENLAQGADSRLSLSDLWSRIEGLKTFMSTLFLISLLVQILALAMPLMLQIVVDQVLVRADVQLLTVVAIGFSLLVLLDVGIRALRALTTLRFGYQFSTQLADSVFRQLVQLPTNFFETRQVGDLVSRFGSIHYLREQISDGMVETILDGLMVSTTFVVMLAYSPLLTLVLVGCMLIYISFRVMLYSRLRSASEKAIVTEALEQSYFMDTLLAIQSIKCFSGESLRCQQWMHRYVDSQNANIKKATVQLENHSAERLFFGMENILSVFLAAHLVLDGSFSIGALFAFMGFKLHIVNRIKVFVERVMQLRMLELHLERLADVTHSAIEAGLDRNLPIMEEEQLNIDFCNLVYRHNRGGPPVLDKLSLKIKAGEKIAIYGPSGAGKSTLAKILLGLSDPESGEAKVNGYPWSKGGKRSLRMYANSVMQSDRLLSGSIIDNIVFFNEAPDIYWAQECAKMAEMHNDIMAMPLGYESPIGDMGAALSAGQAQRVMLARALYAKPKLLVLDEATSHLDGELTAKVYDQLRKMSITMVIISHQPRTLDWVDHQYRLQDKQLVLADVPTKQE